MKIRLHGQASEIEDCTAVLRRTFDVLDESSLYPDRAPSRLSRRYLEVLRPVPDPQGEAIARVLAEVSAERFRQLDKWGVQHRENGTSIALTHAATIARERCQQAEAAGGADWARVLAEEVSEAFAEEDPAALRKELVQIAAVCTAWIEDIDCAAPHSAAAPF